MEKTPSFNKLHRPLGVVLALGSVTLLAGCSAGSYEITADKPALVISENESQRYVTPEEGGYPHYKSVYRFIIEQCDRKDLSIADKNGCVELSTEVSELTFEQIAPGDIIMFDSNQNGYPVDNR
jgi:hypothetical protein